MEVADDTQSELTLDTIIDLMMKTQTNKLQLELTLEGLMEGLTTAQTLLQLMTSLDKLQSGILSTENEHAFFSVIREIYLPLIKSIHLAPPSERGRAASLLAELALTCCRHITDRTLPVCVIQILQPFFPVNFVSDGSFPSVKNEGANLTLTNSLDNICGLEVLSCILNKTDIFNRLLENILVLKISVEDFLENLFQALILCAEDQSLFCKIFIMVSKLLSHSPKALQRKWEEQIWLHFVKACSSKDSRVQRDLVWRALYVCYCLKNWYFPVGESEKEKLSLYLGDSCFWNVVQAGLISPDSALRKISMYLLKRLVDTCARNACSVSSCDSGERPCSSDVLFWWTPTCSRQISQLWEDFILLDETLEEKQVHIIKPLLKRMDTLVLATSVSENGRPLLHSSWLIVIVTRCFQHESHFMSRWGALTLCTLDFTKVPLVQHGQLRFLSHDLLVFLQENKLYSRYEGTELGKSSPVGEALKEFFANLFAGLSRDQKVEYLGNVLGIIRDNSWGSIPLTFICEGMSHIPAEPLVGHELLQLIRQILQSCLLTVESFTRGAIECFLCQVALKLVDLESVSLSECFNTFATLNRKESLQRGTTLWEEVLLWLASDHVWLRWKDTEVYNLALEFLEETLHDQETSVIVDGYRVVSIARMLLLYADVLERRLLEAEGHQTDLNIVRALEESPMGLLLAQVAEVLLDIRSRSYLNLARTDRCISLLFTLAQEAKDYKNGYVDQLLKLHFAAVFKDLSCYVRIRLSDIQNKVIDMGEVKFYADVLHTLGVWCLHCWPELKELAAFSRKILEAAATQSNSAGDRTASNAMLTVSALKLLSAICKILASSGQEESLKFLKEVCDTALVCGVPLPFSGNCARESEQKANIGRLVGRFISSKWQCLGYVFKMGSPEQVGGTEPSVYTREGSRRILNEAMEDLSIGSGSSDIAIFEALEIVMGELVERLEPSDLCELISQGWSKVMEEKKNGRFWKKLQAWIHLLLHPALLRQQDSIIAQTVDQFLEKLLTLGADKTGIMYLVFDHLCHQVLTQDPGRQLATRLIPVLVDGCCIGTVHKRGERVWLDVCAYIENLANLCSVNQVASCVSKNDLYTRVIVLNWLSSLCPDVPADRVFVLEFLNCLSSKYTALAFKTAFKQFPNSLGHRQKHRMVSVLLLMVDFIKKDEGGKYLAMLWQALEVECHPSVRQMLEWLLMILINNNPDTVSSLWEVFELFNNKRSMCLCSLLLIVSHLGLKLPSAMQEEFYSRAVRDVLPWTMAHHYTTRIFAQATLTQLWSQCGALGLARVMDQHAAVQTVIDFLSNNGNASNTVPKLLSHYMYAPFDPVKDFSVETIFHTLPKLACLADDEWILPKHFLKIDPTWQTAGRHLIILRNLSPDLAACREGAWRMRVHHDDDDEAAVETAGNVQKKIMPWRQMCPTEDSEQEFSSQRQKRSDGELILVTTLIDKVPNLGGLCRTSEIFGVSEFVIGNMTYLEDRMFQSLSVSAQKWIKVTEVPVLGLVQYLEDKHRQGYTLVGVEQTANSVSLQQYQFPRKTLLLLGNEREGIPVDIIQMLDVCVEIPQLGVIRSLNVHVCGALIIWEYTRQHMRNTEVAI